MRCLGGVIYQSVALLALSVWTRFLRQFCGSTYETGRWANWLKAHGAEWYRHQRIVVM
jgi:hypothetical protein